MLSEERLSAIRAKVNRANSSQNKKVQHFQAFLQMVIESQNAKKKVLRLPIVLLFAARLKKMKR